MANKAQLQRILDAYASLREDYAAVGVRQGAAAALNLNRLAKRIVELVGAGTNAEGLAIANEAQLNRLLKDLDVAVADFRTTHKATFDALYRDAGNTVLTATPQAYAVFGGSTVDRLQSARDAFINRTKNIHGAGFQNWSDRFNDASGVLRGGMRRTLINAQLSGWDQRSTASSFLKIPDFQFANLPPISEKAERIFNLGGRLSPADALVRRAHMIAKTETTNLEQNMHTAWTQEAGMDRYQNFNSDPVAEECIAANDEDPMTMDEWEAWGDENGWVGVPARHPNCDSQLMAVPPDFVPSLSGMTSEPLEAP